MTDPRYPIGAFKYEGELTEEGRRRAIDAIAEAPARLRAAVEGLLPQQLETPYRPGGWTVRQLVHHLPDSHLNAYTRFKLALTEEEPTIKPYDEAQWANLARSEEHTSELQSPCNLVCRLLLEKKKPRHHAPTRYSFAYSRIHFLPVLGRAGPAEIGSISCIDDD